MFHFKSVTALLALSLLLSCTAKKDANLKILNQVVNAKIKGLDPHQTNDTYSSEQIGKIYEGLLEYHYFKRPYELIPNLAAEMPTVSSDGLTYTFKLKKGVLFHDNACFPGGKGREMKASDFMYSFKRFADSRTASLGWWLWDGKVAGLNEWREKNAKLEKTNYEEEIQGLKQLDDYTIQITLTEKSPQFLYSLAMSYTVVIPKEAVDMYGEEFLNNPVGTGPFLTSTYTQSNEIIYYKNPNYRQLTYPTEGTEEDKANGFLADAGKKIPFVDKIVVQIQPESLPRWLNFEKGKLDYVEVPKDQFAQVVTPDQKMIDDYAKRGMQLMVIPDLDVAYIAFNYEDPILKDVRIRRAMSLAYDTKEANKLFYMNLGTLSQGVIPPGIAGYDSDYENPYVAFDLEKAKKLLAEAGYPEGKGLPAFKYEHVATSTARQMAEFFQSQMAQIGVKIEANSNTWPQLNEKTKNKQAQVFGMAWLADYPDAENFLQLLYGPNQSPGPNGSNYDNAEFNQLFKKAITMQHSDERTRLYEKLNRMAAEDVPLIFGVHRAKIVSKHGWLKNYKYSAIGAGFEKYYNIDLKERAEKIKGL